MRVVAGLAMLLFLVPSCGKVPATSGDVDARVTTPQTLTVAVQGSGSGHVTSEPPGIDCPGTCSAEFPPNSQVTLTQTVMPTSAFTGWAKDCTGEGDCMVTMDGAKTVEPTFSLHGERRWVHQVSFPGDDYVTSVVTDAQGNVFITGTISIDSSASFDLYAMKLSPAGDVIWEKKFTTATGEYDGGHSAVDADGNLYMAGAVTGFNMSGSYDGHDVPGDIYGNVVVMRFAAADGHVEWIDHWGGSAQDRPSALALSGDDLYVIGETDSSPSTFGSFTVSASQGDAFLAKVSRADGTVTKLRTFGGNNQMWDVAANGGDVMVVGSYQSAVTIDNRTFTPTSGSKTDGLILDFAASDLTLSWGKAFGDSTGSDAAHRVAPYPGGGFVVTGGFYGSVIFTTSGQSLTSAGGMDIFVARFQASGTHVWSFRYGSANSETGGGVAVTPGGEVALAGSYADSVTFGTTTLTGSGLFLTRMSSGTTPMHLWTESFGGDNYDNVSSAAFAPNGDVYMLGYFSGMTNIGGMALTSQAMDSYVVGLVR